MMPDIAFAIKFIVLPTAFIASLFQLQYMLLHQPLQLSESFSNKNARSVRSNEKNEKENLE